MSKKMKDLYYLDNRHDRLYIVQKAKSRKQARKEVCAIAAKVDWGTGYTPEELQEALDDNIVEIGDKGKVTLISL